MMTDENTEEQTNGAAAAEAIPMAAPGQRQLDPNRPMYHLVPPSTMQDLLDILKALPYEKVHRVMPVLVQCPIHQEPEG